jgi:tetratricopeptide (TPR) repeat protein
MIDARAPAIIVENDAITPSAALAIDAGVPLPLPPIDAPDVIDAPEPAAMAAITPDAAPVVETFDAAVAAAAPLDAGPVPFVESGDDTEPADPTTADDPDPVAVAVAAGSGSAADDEAADAPATTDEAEKKSPAAPVLAASVKEAVQMIKDGKRELALSSLRALSRKNPDSAYIHFLLGNLYYDKRWWSVAMDHYRLAITRNNRYRANATLDRNVIRTLASVKTRGKAIYFLRRTIGHPAAPYLRYAAAHDPNSTVRKHAAALARIVR